MAKQERRLDKPVVTVEPAAPGTRHRSRDETRSHFVMPATSNLPSETNPCQAPAGNHWVHSSNSDGGAERDPLLIGKWLLRVGHPYVSNCWDRVRTATEDGTLGIAAKVSTDWGMRHDPAGFGVEGLGGWRTHVVCVYTQDWRDRDDVFRVGRRLHTVDAVRKQPITYKADASTYGGMYAGNAPGEVALYRLAPPYEALHEYEGTIKLVLGLVEQLRART